MDQKPLFLGAQIEIESTADAPARFSGIAYSGAVFSHYGYPTVVDLASLSVPPSAPLLLEHERSSPIGVAESIQNDGRAISDEGSIFSDFDAAAKSVADKAGRGLRYQQSLGVFDYAIESLRAGATADINGQPITGPVDIYRDGTVREISIVVLGADGATSATFFSAGGTRHEDDTMAEDTRVAEAQAAVVALTAERDALAADLAVLTAEREALLAAARAAREREIDALFAALSLPLDTEKAPYLAMTADVFAAVSAHMKAAHASASTPDDFRRVAEEGEETKKKAPLSLAAVYDARKSGGAK